jgi:4-amino-4-deoxy-L-arabinose transferase-like glycosyltransferase
MGKERGLNGGMIKSYCKKNYHWIILFVVFFVLLFSNFDNIYISGDEGVTALGAENVLKYGYPRVYDGKNWIKGNLNLESGVLYGNETYTKDLAINDGHPWLQYYITAASFSIFGFNAFGAKFFFVIIAFLSLFLIYKLYKILYPKEEKTRFLAMLLILTSVFFFLYSRQARYFSLVLFFTTWMLIHYLKFLKERKNKDLLFFSIAAILLFHSSYAIFFITFLTLAIFTLFFSDWKSMFKQIIIACLGIILFTLPWFLYTITTTPSIVGNFFSLISFFDILPFLLKRLNYHIPIIFFLLLPVLLFVKKKTKPEVFSDKFVFVLVLVTIVITLLLPFKFFRGIYGFTPIFMIFLSRAYFWALKKNRAVKIIAIILLVIFMLSNLLSFIPMFIFSSVAKEPLKDLCKNYAPSERIAVGGNIYDAKSRCEVFIEKRTQIPYIQFPIFYYLYEITHDYDSPDEGVVNYLNSYGSEDDVVFVYYSYYPIQFYTDMRIIDPFQANNQSLLDEEGITRPDWIVPRWKNDSAVNSLEEYAINNGYKAIELPYPDLFIGNEPWIYDHYYWTPNNKYIKNVVIYQRPGYLSEK